MPENKYNGKGKYDIISKVREQMIQAKQNAAQKDMTLTQTIEALAKIGLPGPSAKYLKDLLRELDGIKASLNVGLVDKVTGLQRKLSELDGLMGLYAEEEGKKLKEYQGLVPCVLRLLNQPQAKVTQEQIQSAVNAYLNEYGVSLNKEQQNKVYEAITGDVNKFAETFTEDFQDLSQRFEAIGYALKDSQEAQTQLEKRINAIKEKLKDKDLNTDQKTQLENQRKKLQTNFDYAKLFSGLGLTEKQKQALEKISNLEGRVNTLEQQEKPDLTQYVTQEQIKKVVATAFKGYAPAAPVLASGYKPKLGLRAYALAGLACLGFGAGVGGCLTTKIASWFRPERKVELVYSDNNDKLDAVVYENEKVVDIHYDNGDNLAERQRALQKSQRR